MFPVSGAVDSVEFDVWAGRESFLMYPPLTKLSPTAETGASIIRSQLHARARGITVSQWVRAP